MTNAGSCSITEIEWCGFEAFALENSLVKAIIVPTLGGKIVSLQDLSTNHEWLWRNPDLDLIVPGPSPSYIRNLGGWDECFPSVSESRVPCGFRLGATIPDHGEIWSVPWEQHFSASGNRVDFTTRVQGTVLPYIFERVLTIEVGLPKITFRYKVQNLAVEPIPFIWSCHPTLAATPGDKLSIPVKEMSIYKTLGDRFGGSDEKMDWPVTKDIHGQLWNFEILPEPTTPTSLKLFAEQGVVDCAHLEDVSTGSKFVFSFDPADITHLGLWLNFKAWAVVENGPKYYCIAIEPCIGDSDDLQIAYANNSTKMIPPKGEYAWNLTVQLAKA